MNTLSSGFLKHRAISFNPLHPDPNQAQSAALQLTGLPGVVELQAVSPVLLEIRYDLLAATLEQIERLLTAQGFHLDNRLLCKLLRALHYFAEETERANQGCPRGTTNCTQKVFLNRYARQNHDCRDRRPEHWRHYL
jgi:hypothetical protein